jgi:hypothetical protein
LPRLPSARRPCDHLPADAVGGPILPRGLAQRAIWRGDSCAGALAVCAFRLRVLSLVAKLVRVWISVQSLTALATVSWPRASAGPTRRIVPKPALRPWRTWREATYLWIWLRFPPRAHSTSANAGFSFRNRT